MSYVPKRPITILWTILIFISGTHLYCRDESTLSGPWILDDKGTVTMNPVVLEGPWSEVWIRDFWGRNRPQDKKSHKSWRPLTTASYKLNYILTNRWYGVKTEPNPYWFHVVDRILHGIVSALSYMVALYSLRASSGSLNRTNKSNIFVDSVSVQALMTALLFTTHPIHTEAVANTTGRAEVLCALFYFIGFWIYVQAPIRSFYSTFSNLVGTIMMLLFTLLATLSKEHGINLPIVCVIWDFFTFSVHHLPVDRSKEESDELKQQEKRKELLYSLCIRIFISMTGMMGIGYWRLLKNGSTEPDFVCEQNPAACQNHFITRFLYLNYLWVVNFWLLLCPDALSPDRSGDSIPMLHHPATDPRVPAIFLMWILLAIILYITISVVITSITSMLAVTKYSRNNQPQHAFTCSIIIAFMWMLVPFLMSSNLLVYVGFVVADRTLYLPSFGFCLLLAQLLPLLISSTVDWFRKKGRLMPDDSKPSLSKARSHRWSIHEVLCASVFIILLTLYTKKLIRQNERWSDPVLLWGEAYRLYPSSCINGKEYGMSLVNAQKPRDAIPVLLDMSKREMANIWFTQTVESFRKEHFSTRSNSQGMRSTLDISRKRLSEIGRFASILQTRFKLVTAMGNVGQCDEANRIIDDGLQLIESSLREIHDIKKSSVLDKEILETEISDGNEISDEKEAFSDSIKSIEEAMISNQAYILVSKSRCSSTLLDMAKFAYAAVQTKANMDYCLEHAKTVSELVAKTQSANVDVAKVDIVRTVNQDGQSVQISFAVRS